jgi:hypothetical protein
MKEINAVAFNRITEASMMQGAGKIAFDAKSGRTRFDQAAVQLMKASKGMFCHFIPFEGKFYVAVNLNQDGYWMTAITGRDGLCVSNTKFIRHFFIKNKIRKETVTCSLIQSEDFQWKGKPVFEIMTLTEK